MPEGSVELDTPIMCWPAKTHIIVIIALHVGSALVIIASGIAEFAMASSERNAGVKANTNAADAAAVGDAVGVFVLMCILMPAFYCLLKGIFTSYLCCCKSKCCYGYFAIVAIISVGSTAYSTITSFTGGSAFAFLFVASLLSFPITIKLIGGMGILVVLNTAYCAFVLCKLSYCDRAGGGEDSEDIYSLDDLEKNNSVSEMTR